jgi:hypothetical protein
MPMRAIGMQISTADPKSQHMLHSQDQAFISFRLDVPIPNYSRIKRFETRGTKAGDTLLLRHQIPGQELYLYHTAILIDDDVCK